MIEAFCVVQKTVQLSRHGSFRAVTSEACFPSGGPLSAVSTFASIHVSVEDNAYMGQLMTCCD